MDSFIILYLDDILHSIKHRRTFAKYRNNARDKEEAQNSSDLKKCEFIVNYLYMGFLFTNDDI